MRPEDVYRAEKERALTQGKRVLRAPGEEPMTKEQLAEAKELFRIATEQKTQRSGRRKKQL